MRNVSGPPNRRQPNSNDLATREVGPSVSPAPVNPLLTGDEIDVRLPTRKLRALDRDVELLVLQDGILPVNDQSAVDANRSIIIHCDDGLTVPLHFN